MVWTPDHRAVVGKQAEIVLSEIEATLQTQLEPRQALKLKEIERDNITEWAKLQTTSWKEDERSRRRN